PQSTASLTESEAARHVLLHEFELTDQAKRIGNRKKYQLVAHVAWIQPGYAQDDAIAFPLADLAGVASGLQGDITLYLSRYLHMQFNLIITEPDGTPEPEPTTTYDRLLSLPMATGADQPPVSSPVYRMDEKRRMRSGELHYIDHPNFGALARVTKVDPVFLVE
ncbi:MAG: peptidoglycan binding protein CsiV, partial [Gammaproteobacteria bacterium]|nr:peptidoglycan binding protein CsiV [Gammaproteobacteria bacterium]